MLGVGLAPLATGSRAVPRAGCPLAPPCCSCLGYGVGRCFSLTHRSVVTLGGWQRRAGRISAACGGSSLDGIDLLRTSRSLCVSSALLSRRGCLLWKRVTLNKQLAELSLGISRSEQSSYGQSVPGIICEAKLAACGDARARWGQDPALPAGCWSPAQDRAPLQERRVGAQAGVLHGEESRKHRCFVPSFPYASVLCRLWAGVLGLAERLLNNCVWSNKNELTPCFCGRAPTVVDSLPDVRRCPLTLCSTSEGNVGNEEGNKIWQLGSSKSAWAYCWLENSGVVACP